MRGESRKGEVRNLRFLTPKKRTNGPRSTASRGGLSGKLGKEGKKGEKRTGPEEDRPPESA